MGAVVADCLGQVVLLERRVLRAGDWVQEVRLPKGALQARETDAEAAVAEVERLTGFHDLEVVADLGKVPVEYEARGVRYRRSEHYFLLKLRSHEKAPGRGSRPDRPSAQTLSFAPGFAEAAERLSFPSEQDAVLRARAWWPA